MRRFISDLYTRARAALAAALHPPGEEQLSWWQRSWIRIVCLLVASACLCLVIAVHATSRHNAPRQVAAAIAVAPPATPMSTVTSTSTSTRTPSATASPSPSATPSSTETASATASPLPSPSATARPPTPIPTATIDPVYYAQDTLEGTGPGPAGPLSGLPTRPDLLDRRPIAVVLDNYAPDARPQTGLNRASLVYETLAEGGVTRLMAIYLERDAPIIGPVRSARIYFTSWAAGLRAIYGHAGGNSDALYELAHMQGPADVDDLNLPVAPYAADVPYWRSPDRAAPHNLYTSTGALRAYAQQAGQAISGQWPVALAHRAPDAPPHRAPHSWIEVDFSGSPYNVRWTFDPASDRYRRSVDGTIWADPISRRPVAASNVVVLITRISPDPDPFAPDGINVHTVGSGRALYFRDGHLVEGTWRKRHIGAPLELLDAHGKPQALNPGQTWIEAVAGDTPLSWDVP